MIMFVKLLSNMSDTHQRRLAAIMFTDIAGYTALMQEDEARAIELRQRHREVFEKYHKEYAGNILQYYGDGTLSVFDSAIDAVNCAVTMQQAFQEAPQVPLRIGIHTGDIVYSKEEAIGDGVNVAARVESMAVPGNVLISEKVYDYIKNQPEISTRSMGKYTFKNVQKPMEIFAIEAEQLVVPKPRELTGKFTRRQLPDSWFSRLPVATKYLGGFVLFLLLTSLLYFPLMNLAGNKDPDDLGGTEISLEEQKRFFVGPFTNKGDTAFKWLKVAIPYALEMEWDQDPYIFNIYPESNRTFNFTDELENARQNKLPLLLQGEYEVIEGVYSLSLQFFDVQTGRKLPYDLNFSDKDLFSLLDTASFETKKALGVPKAHLDRVTDLPVESFLTNNEESFRSFSIGIINQFRYLPYMFKAVELDSTFAWAHYEISKFQHLFQRSEQKAQKHIKLAMRYRKRLPEAFDVQVRKLNFNIQDQPEKALQLAEYLYNNDPNNHTHLVALKNLYRNLGKFEKFREMLIKERVVIGEPQHDKENEAFALWQMGEYEDALDILKELKGKNASALGILMLEGVILAEQGKYDEAMDITETAMLLDPELRPLGLLKQHIQFLQDSASYIDQTLYKSFVGTYQPEFNAMKFEVWLDGEKLMLKNGNRGLATLFPIGKYKYTTRDGMRLNFWPNSLGMIDRVQTYENGNAFFWLKKDDLIQNAMDLLENDKLEEALTNFEKAYEEHPDFDYLKKYIEHIEFRKSPAFQKYQQGLSKYSGEFVHEDLQYVLTNKNGKLFMRAKPGVTFIEDTELIPTGPNMFMSKLATIFTFEAKPQGGKVNQYTRRIGDYGSLNIKRLK